ncbi:hypothetical protein MSAN_02294000 [Mycena sanguinolenta]|uniref:Uncharacterized protein n=1 Tax=Mycena sanguinolenta TaxID=230812 RepID=A0A8H6X8L8_9AGAR|nr:hypothetical protein MSAN_02294000 [Mycena sanguinolenta]
MARSSSPLNATTSGALPITTSGASCATPSKPPSAATSSSSSTSTSASPPLFARRSGSPPPLSETARCERSCEPLPSPSCDLPKDRDAFSKYLESTLPERPDLPDAQADDAVLAACSEALLRLFMVLVIRSIYMHLNDADHRELLEVLNAFRTAPVPDLAGLDFGMLQRLASIGLGRRWDYAERMELAFSIAAACGGVGPFGSHPHAVTDRTFILRIDRKLPPLPGADPRPEVPDFFEDENLDRYYHEVRDAFFALLRRSRAGDSSDAEARELCFYRAVLRAVETDAENDKQFSALYDLRLPPCPDGGPEPELLRSYAPGGVATFRRTPLAELEAWGQMTSAQRKRLLAQDGKSDPMDVSDDEAEDGLAALPLRLPPVPPAKASASDEHYDCQQRLVPIFRAAALCFGQRRATEEEVAWLGDAARFLAGHPLSNRASRISHLAKDGPLAAAELLGVRTMASANALPGEPVDVAMPDPPRDERREVAHLRRMIRDLGPDSTGCAQVLGRVQGHAASTVYVCPTPLYHATARAANAPSVPPLFRQLYGALSEFLKSRPAATLHVGLLVLQLDSVFGVSHAQQVSNVTHAVVIAIVVRPIPNTNRRSRALLVWDANVLSRPKEKTKGSLDDHVRTALRLARAEERVPNFESFWVCSGRPKPHADICLGLALEQLLRMAVQGLDVRWELGRLVELRSWSYSRTEDTRIRPDPFVRNAASALVEDCMRVLLSWERDAAAAMV